MGKEWERNWKGTGKELEKNEKGKEWERNGKRVGLKRGRKWF